MSLLKDIPAWWARLRSVEGANDVAQLAKDWVVYSTISALRAPFDPLGGSTLLREQIPKGVLIGEIGLALTYMGVPPAVGIPTAVGIVELDSYLGQATHNIARSQKMPAIGPAVRRTLTHVLDSVGERQAVEGAVRMDRQSDNIQDAIFSVREEGTPLEPIATLGILRAMGVDPLPGLDAELTSEVKGDVTFYTLISSTGNLLRRAIMRKLIDGRFSWASVLRE